MKKINYKIFAVRAAVLCVLSFAVVFLMNQATKEQNLTNARAQMSNNKSVSSYYCAGCAVMHKDQCPKERMSIVFASVSSYYCVGCAVMHKEQCPKERSPFIFSEL